jgi:hypothetical protein
MTRSNGLGDDGEQLETDEDQETIRTSGRKEPRSHMDLEPDQETGYPDKNQGVTWTPPGLPGSTILGLLRKWHTKNSTA